MDLPDSQKDLRDSSQVFCLEVTRVPTMYKKGWKVTITERHVRRVIIQDSSKRQKYPYRDKNSSYIINKVKNLNKNSQK